MYVYLIKNYKNIYKIFLLFCLYLFSGDGYNIYLFI